MKMTFRSKDAKARLSEEESELYEALAYFGNALITLDHCPASLARAALVFSAVGFAAFDEVDDFADRSKELYYTLKANLAEVAEEDVFH
jgi:hypothetical protein